jgi:3-phenylpropionate/cinnamic acid dioxygenase small subunit
MAEQRSDASQFSYYINDEFYLWLTQVAREWSRVGRPPNTPVREECEQLLIREARLIDDREFTEWLDLFTRECLYWIPATPGGGDPRREVSLEFHDRRRLEDRIARLQTGCAYSQIPPTRTRHLLTNIEMWTVSPQEVRARANFMIYTYRSGIQRAVPGWCGYVLRQEEGSWKIAVKQINLIDSDQGQENNSFVL